MRVLVVEDEALIRTDLGEALTAAGFLTESCAMAPKPCFWAIPRTMTWSCSISGSHHWTGSASCASGGTTAASCRSSY